MERSACPTCGSCSGMFTANSMNCLNEALGLALPGNGHAFGDARAALGAVRGRFQAYRRDGEAALRGRRQERLAPQHRGLRCLRKRDGRSTSRWAASTNTVLHILAIAHEAGVSFTMADMDRMSRKVAEPVQGRAVELVPRRKTCTARAASSRFWVSSTKRAFCIADVGTVARQDHWAKPSTSTTFTARRPRPRPKARALAAPGGVATKVAFLARTNTSTSPTRISSAGCIRDAEHAFSQEGGLAVLYGNFAQDGLHREKRPASPKSIWKFEGSARVFNSQDAACDAIMADKIEAGDGW